MSELTNIANRIKKEQDNMEEELEMTDDISNALSAFEIEEDENVVDSDADDDDDPVVVIGGIDNKTASNIELTDEDLIDDTDEFSITDDDLKAEMPDLDENTFNAASSKIKEQIASYRKNLIIREGLTTEEANEAAMARMKSMANKENTEYLKENPNLGVVEVNKKDVDKLEFTKEEREKLFKVKSIKLKVVEDAELKSIKIKKVDKNRKGALLQSLDTNLSQYSVPIPLSDDYCRFKGTQIIQLVQAVNYEDATVDEIISNKASLVYNQLVNGFNLRKTDENGKVIMSYQDFINKFLYHDLDMALYAILVASSMEDIETALTCRQCDSQFQWKYNLKSLLNLDDLNDDFKAKFDDILKHKTDGEYLNALYEKDHVSKRVKSPITNNIYDLNYPTVARAINLYRMINQEDDTMVYLSIFALFIDTMYVYDKKTDDYIQIDEDEYKNLLEILQMIPQEEIDIIQKFLQPYLYAPKFILKSHCERCGHDMTNNLSIDQLVFLKARDSSTEIQ